MSFFPERRSARYEFQRFPWIFSLQMEEPAAADAPLRVEARNVSRGGLKFVTNRRIALFETVRGSLLDENGQLVAQLTGKVVRVEEVDTGHGERTYGIAVEFTAGADALEKLIPETDAT